MHMTFKDMKVFYNGGELVDTDTFSEKWIDDDCILHAVDNVYDAPTLVVKSWSAKLNQWRLLLPHNLQPPARNKVAEKELSPRPLSSVVSGASPAASHGWHRPIHGGA